MKKLLCTALAVISTLSFAACSTSKGDGEVNDTASSTQSSSASSTTSPSSTSKENLSDKVSDLGENIDEGMDDAGNAVRDMLE